MTNQPDCSFAELYKELAPALFTWANLRILPGLRESVEPEDIVSETCIRGFRSYQRFDPAHGSFRAWMFGIAHNVLREILKRSSRTEARMASDSEEPPLESIPDDITSVSRRVCRDETLREFALSLRDLSEEEGRLIIYRGIEGLEHAETAKILGISPQAVEKRWQRLIKKVQGMSRLSSMMID